ncbi:MAG: hypothetical protein VR70_10950 [Rhodospirillaceae bacterium BRH_c57]|nr:MAG: hypothetical protein VR70_10950 [Rhodospirillaceae bacterium BRH_c57]
MMLGEAIVARGLITPKELDYALSVQKVTGSKLGHVLVSKRFIRHSDLVKILAEISPDSLTSESVRDIRPTTRELRLHKVIIAAETRDEVFAATLGSQRQAHLMLKGYYPDKAIRWVPLAPEKMDSFIERADFLAETANVGENTGDRMLSKLIDKAVRMGASDIHISADEDCYHALARVDGSRQLIHMGTREEHTQLLARIKDIGGMDTAETRNVQDGGFNEERDGHDLSYRINSIPTEAGATEKVTIRILDPDQANPSLEDLGITRLDQWKKGISRDRGICIIAGPTGSGKSTTLQATVRGFDRVEKAVYTIEDPVEYRIPLVDQVNVNPLVGLDFAKGLKGFMRADPDIIVVGEIRDEETARLAMKAAETGHLVLATVHAGSPRAVLNRLKNLGMDMHSLREELRAIMVQRLVRTLCAECKGGCAHCGGTGYRGRTLVSECQSFTATEDSRRLFETADVWWPTLEDDARLKITQGITDESQVERLLSDI